jgi:citrate synthase
VTKGQIFSQFYGLRDMDYNQLLLCMSRALGIVASMIWTTALNAPVERPRSKCTYTYFNDFRNDNPKSRSKFTRISRTPTNKHLK